MSVREIPRADWAGFLDEFSLRHRAWLATVERLAPGEPPRPEAIERPLQCIAFRAEVPDEGRIEIRFQQDLQAPEAVWIDTPLKLGVSETSQHTEQGLEIIDRNGASTQVRFRTAPPPEALDGVAPGELSPK